MRAEDLPDDRGRTVIAAGRHGASKEDADTRHRIERAIRLIASWGLDGGGGDGDPLRFVDREEWGELLARIRFERINGLAVGAAAGGGLDLTDEQAGELLKLHRAGMVWCLHAEQKLLRLADAFDAEGIGFAVLKGPALAHTVYEEPCLRPFGDLDLLVRSRDYDRSAALLARLGHVRRRPEPRPGWEARFGKASVHVDPDDGIEVDLHRTLVLGPFGQWIDGDELMDHRAIFPLGGRDLPRLDDTGMLLNVALHASLGWTVPRIAPIRDTAELDANGVVDVSRLTVWTREWHLAAVIRRASDLVATLPGGRTDRVLGRIPGPVGRRDRRLLLAYTDERTDGGLPLGTIRAIPGIRAKLDYARALAFPGQDFLRHRGLGTGGRASLARLGEPVRWARRPTARGSER